MNEKSKQLLLNGKGLKYLVDTAYKILGNPIVVHGMAYELLANSQNKVTDDWLWNELISNKRFSHQTVNFFNNVKFIKDVADTEETVMLKSKDIKYDRICSKLFDKKYNQIGCFTVIGCYKPLNKQDFKDISIICEYMSKELQASEYYSEVEKVIYETTLSDIIDCKINEEINLQERLDDLYSGLKKYIFVAVVDISQYEHTVTQLIYLKETLKSLQPEYKYFIYLNNIVILISKNSSILNIKEDIPKLNEFFSKNNIFAGVSKSFENLLEIKIFFKQAFNALNYGLESKENNYIFNYHNYLLNSLINSSKDNIDFIDYCHPYIKIIIEYDKENKTDYFNILSEYLRNIKNKRLTSQHLNITKNTLDKSLKHIKRLTGIDWNNGNEILNICVSIKLKKIL